GVRAFVERASGPDGDVVERLRLIDDAGGVVIECRGLILQEHRAGAPRYAPGVGEWFYEVNWVPQAIGVDATIRTQAKADDWLVVGDGAGIAVAMARLLEARGQRVTRLDAADAAGLDRAVAAHAAGDAALRGVIWLCGLDERAPENASLL